MQGTCRSFLSVIILSFMLSCGSGTKDSPNYLPEASPEIPTDSNENPTDLPFEVEGPESPEQDVSAPDPWELSWSLSSGTSLQFYQRGETIKAELVASSTGAYQIFYVKEHIPCDESSLATESPVISGETNTDSLAINLERIGVFHLCLVFTVGEDRRYYRSQGTVAILPDNAVLWLRADAGVEAMDGKVLFWNDQSKNRFRFQAASQDVAPQWNTERLPATIRFDGSDDFLYAPANNLTVQTVVSVFQARQEDTNRARLGPLWGSYSEGAHLAIDPRNDSLGYSFDGAGTSTASFGENSFQNLSIQSSEDVEDATWQFDTMQWTIVSYDTPQIINQQYIGSLSARDNHFLGGDIAEVFVFDRELNPDERFVLERYIRHRWDPSLSRDPSQDVRSLVARQDGLKALLNWRSSGGGSTAFQIAMKKNSEPVDCYDGSVSLIQEVSLNMSVPLGDLEAGDWYIRVCSVNQATGYRSAGKVTNLRLETAVAPNPIAVGRTFWMRADQARVDSLARIEVITDTDRKAIALKQDDSLMRPNCGQSHQSCIPTSFLTAWMTF